MTDTSHYFDITDYAFIDSTRDASGVETAPPRLEGYAVVFNTDSVEIFEPGKGRFIERIRPGFCRESLDAVIQGRHIHAFWSHNHAEPLGSTRNGNLVLREDERGIWFSLSLERFDRKQLLAARDNDLQMSFGMRNVVYQWSRRGKAKIGEIIAAEVFEISPVVFPAFTDTVASVRAARNAMIASAEAWEADETRADDGDSETAELDGAVEAEATEEAAVEDVTADVEVVENQSDKQIDDVEPVRTDVAAARLKFAMRSRV